MTLTHSIETYLPQNLEEPKQSSVDVPMQDPMALTETEDSTPRPKSKKNVITDFGTEDNDSQIDDDDFKTPKALTQTRCRIPIIASDNDSSDGLRITNDQAQFNGDKYNEEIEYETGNWEQEIREHKTKTSKQDKQTFKTIDLTKVQKRATEKKDKWAFQKEVDERRVQLARKQEV